MAVDANLGLVVGAFSPCQCAICSCHCGDVPVCVSQPHNAKVPKTARWTAEECAITMEREARRVRKDFRFLGSCGVSMKNGPPLKPKNRGAPIRVVLGRLLRLFTGGACMKWETLPCHALDRSAGSILFLPKLLMSKENDFVSAYLLRRLSAKAPRKADEMASWWTKRELLTKILKTGGEDFQVGKRGANS